MFGEIPGNVAVGKKININNTLSYYTVPSSLRVLTCGLSN